MAIYNPGCTKTPRTNARWTSNSRLPWDPTGTAPASRQRAAVFGMQPQPSCQEVGGDYFDYFDLAGGASALRWGTSPERACRRPAGFDGSRHLSAQTLFEPTAGHDLQCNRTLVQRGTGSRFLTFFFGILDPEATAPISMPGTTLLSSEPRWVDE